jgi:signal transduction histidine kinase
MILRNRTHPRMSDATLVDRLAGLTNLAGIPREELEWLVAHGRLETREAGSVLAPKGQRIEKLWIILSGHVAVRVDRGAGPRRVMGWHAGEVGGMLPYSRMTAPPGDNYLEEAGELLTVDEQHFPAMIHGCPAFTAYTVHLMLDRARAFSASDLHDEKMISLGKLAAGLAHELNNPASATARGAKLLLESLTEADAASRALGAQELAGDLIGKIEGIRAAALAEPVGAVLSPMEQADREDTIADWLIAHQSSPAHAGPLAGTPVTIDMLDALANSASGHTLDTVLRWIAAGYTTRSLATDIERSANRIHELVSAIKTFTYMDKMAGPEAVDVEAGLRDTLRVLASKAKSKGGAITLDLATELPRVSANGGEMNQVWLNLIDNALDAIPESGRIEIRAEHDLKFDRVVVRVIDNGPGISAEVLPRIFDPFFTTKPPGQGTGLGLEITRRLLRRYGGDILVESRPGRTEFRVTLVVQKPADRDGDARPEHPSEV